jgi:uncharacterized protein
MNEIRAARSRLYTAPSSVEGVGVFTRDAIAARAHVLDCGGVRLTTAELEKASDSLRVMQVGPDAYLAEDPDNPSIDDFLNHSCEPNIGFWRGTLALHALRDILPGEELVFDYSTCMNEPGWMFTCRCGMPTCRQRVCSYCDLSSRDRDRLRGMTLAYLSQAFGDDETQHERGTGVR